MIIILIFAKKSVLRRIVCPSGLKGNQVRILNSPAAVSFAKCDRHIPLKPLDTSGKASATETSQKTCHATHFIIAFEEKALSLMNRTTISCPNHFNWFKESKKVNELCQVYWECPVEVISPGHLFFYKGKRTSCFIEEKSLSSTPEQ